MGPPKRARQLPWLGAVVAAAAVLLLVWGCPKGAGARDPRTLPALTSGNPAAEAALRAADDALRADRSSEARTRYGRFLVEHPNDPLLPLAQLGLGRVHLAAGELQEARALFARVASHSDANVAERGRLYDAVALHLSGQSTEALTRLRPMVGRTVDPDETMLVLETLAAASEQTGDWVGALVALDTLERSAATATNRDTARERIASLARASATTEQREDALLRLRRDGRAYPAVALEALRDANTRGDLPRVRHLVGVLRELGTPLDDELQAIALRAERDDLADPQAIGAILPLSGRGREVGQAALNGLLLAVDSPGRAPHSAAAPQLVFRDDGGDPQRAVQAVDELVSLHRVIAIVGPMTGEGAIAAARRATELRVPIITLSAAPVTHLGPEVFRLFLTADVEAQALAGAAAARNARRVAVLHPANAFGNTMRDAFARAAEAQGLRVVASASYPDGATAFGDAINALPSDGFDAIFLPDSHRRLALIAPALAAAGHWSAPVGEPRSNPRGLLVLAPSVAFSTDLPRQAGRYLQGAVFSAPFFAPTATGVGRRFVDDYQARYGAAPDAFAAFAFDAARLVRRAVGAGARTRQTLAAALSRAGNVETAGAASGFAPTRDALRGTQLYELRDAGFQLLTPDGARAF